jgi:hypothetical protein
LTTGELAFLAKDVPPLAARRYTIFAGNAPNKGNAAAHNGELVNNLLTVRIDPNSGAISELHLKGRNINLVDSKAPTALNDYFYLPGGDLNDLKRNYTPKVSIKETGPLVASLLIESNAPGCNKLTREIRIYDDIGRVDIINLLDKKAIRKKEGAHIGFGFNVPDGQVRLDVQFAVMRPEIDQIPGSCKNWLSVNRWADVSNTDYGITWVTLDAPLVEVGGITANLPGSKSDPYIPWRHKIEPTQTIYSWILNNHWHTNFKADQEGLLTFRYSVMPHLNGYDPVAATHFGIERSQPLLIFPATGKPVATPLLQIVPDDVLISAFKPSDDGRGWIVRLFGVSGQDRLVKLKWNGPAAKTICLSGATEEIGPEVGDKVNVPGWGIVTLRIESAD